MLHQPAQPKSKFLFLTAMNSFWLKRNIFVALILLSFVTLNGADKYSSGNYIIRNYAPGDYNANPQNWCIVQDQRGIMYFGNTGRGVLEYDGSTWRLINISNNSSARSLAIGTDGVIYVGAVGEFGFLACDSKGQLQYVSLAERLNETDKVFSYVRNTLATSHGIYFLTSNNIFRWYKNKLDVIHISMIRSGFKAYNNIFVTRDNGDISILAEGKLSVVPKCKNKFNIESFGRFTILPYPKHRLLIATEKRGFFLFDLDLQSLKEFPTEVESYLERYGLTCNLRISDTLFAYGTRRGGIVLMDHEGKIQRIIDKSLGLQSNIVWELFLDRHQNLWAALNIGVSRLEISSSILQYAESSGLGGMLLSIIKHNNKLYVGAFHGIFSMPLDNNYFTPVGNYRHSCWNFLPIKNALLAAGSRGVFQIIENETLRITDSGSTYCFGLSKKFPDLIFIGRQNGLGYLKLEETDKNAGEQISFIDKGMFKEIHEIIRQVAADNNGNLWLSTRYNGIIHVKFTGNDVNDLQIVRYNTNHGLPQINNNYVQIINNQIIVATQKGIYKGIPSLESDSQDTNFSFVKETTFGNIFNINSCAVQSIMEDKDKRLWINSDIGFGVMSMETGNKYKWNSIPFNKIAANISNCFIESNSTVWVVTNEGKGLFRYDPAVKQNYGWNYMALIRRVTINNGYFLFNGNYCNPSSKQESNFNQHLLHEQPENSVPKLAYKDNSISFEYSAAFYGDESDVRFKYFLQGFDKEWSDWEKQTEKEYTNLHEGTYCFRIKARNIYDYESKEAVFRFSINPPWHRSLIAYFFYGFGVLVFILSAITLHSYRIKIIMNKERKRYELSPDVAKEHLEKLLSLMRTQKPYLDSELNIKRLSLALSIPAYQVSYIINKNLKKTFFNFINEYRIEEAKKVLSDPVHRGTIILDIAYDVGFNSKSSFNKAFKKNTGKTPSQFKKEYRK